MTDLWQLLEMYHKIVKNLNIYSRGSLDCYICCLRKFLVQKSVIYVFGEFFGARKGASCKTGPKAQSFSVHVNILYLFVVFIVLCLLLLHPLSV